MPRTSLSSMTAPIKRRHVLALATALAFALTALTTSRSQAASWPSWPSWLTGQQPYATADLASAAALRALPGNATTPAIAAHATPEGHWLFTNAAGEAFTAGTPAELKRAPAVLAPDPKQNGENGFASVRLVLSRDSAFAGPGVLKDLPATAALYVAVDGVILEARRTPRNTLAVMLRPGVSVEAIDKPDFLEALAQLRRPLDAARMRILSAVPGSPASLPSSPKYDAAQRGAAIDTVDPDRLPDALASIPRQTAILTARLDGANLAVLPPSGPERTISLSALNAAALAADIDLLILHADPPRQPGGRNWLWQRIQVSGLEHATKRGTLADFLDQLAGGTTVFAVTTTADGDTRTRLTAQPIPASMATTEGVTGWIKQAAGTVSSAVTGQVTGAVQPAAIHASLVSTVRRTELSHRLIPALPTSATTLYVIASLLGLFCLPVALRWWRKLWPREVRTDYINTRGYTLARAFRAVAFLTIFLPLAALPALATTLFTLSTRKKPAPAP